MGTGENTPPLFTFCRDIRATSQAPKRQARRGSQLVLMNLLTFLFQHLSSDLEYFYLEAAGLQNDRRSL